MGEAAPIDALKDVSVEAVPGEFIAVMGPSGCGKSTLLHIMGGMDRATQGEVCLGDLPLHDYAEEQLTQVRRTKVGYVFQFFYLLPTFTVEENVELPLLLSGHTDGLEKIVNLLKRVGMSHRLKALPNQLSGGEMQRVAIARAIIHDPPLVIADESTGNLDSETGSQVLQLLHDVSARGTIVVMATHSDLAAQFATRILRMKDGRIV